MIKFLVLMTRKIDRAPEVEPQAMNGVVGNRNIYSLSQRKRNKEEKRA